MLDVLQNIDGIANCFFIAILSCKFMSVALMRNSFHFYITYSHPYFNAVILDSILIVWCSIFHCVVHMVFDVMIVILVH